MQPEIVRILLVEDNPGDSRLVEVVLSEATSSADFEVTHAERLEEALDHLSETGFDVILLDLSLPDSRGLETVTRMQTVASRAPMVILSGQDDEEVALEALHLGAQDYLIKGKGDGDLMARSIRYAIERWRTEEALRRSLDELVALFEAGQVLGSSLEREEIGSKLVGIAQRISDLDAAAIDLLDGQGRLNEWCCAGAKGVLAATREDPAIRSAVREISETGRLRSLDIEQQPSGAEAAPQGIIPAAAGAQPGDRRAGGLRPRGSPCGEGGRRDPREPR
jgi:DNA-binding NarL/FixJ family response regulator